MMQLERNQKCTVAVWDTQSGSLLHHRDDERFCGCLTLHYIEGGVMIACHRDEVLFVDVEDLTISRSFSTPEGIFLDGNDWCASEDNNLFAMFHDMEGARVVVRVLDIGSGELHSEIQVHTSLGKMRFSPDGTLLGSGGCR